MRRHTILQFLLVLSGVVAIGLISAPVSPASASCVGPMISLTAQEADRGQEVTVTGTGWGDNCYDAASPPKGEGRLGRPLEGIEIVISQDEHDRRLTTVDAGDDYRFETTVTIPLDAVPGEAIMMARRPDRPDRPAEPDSPGPEANLVIGRAPPVTSSSAMDATPSAPREANAETTDDSGLSGPWLLGAGLVAVIVLSGGAWLVVTRRKSRRP